MSMWDPYDLMAAPLSAYTPGQGDIKMEGKMETASGAPVYHLEDYLSGNAPYVTGATSRKNPSGQLVYRSVGDNVVPVKITDYGPGVKGIDIATQTKEWAKNFPYQGQKDTTLLTGPTTTPNALQASTARPYDPGVVKPYPSPEPTPPVSGGTYAFGIGSNPAQMSTGADYASAINRGQAVGSAFSGIGNALAQLGQSQARQSQQGMNQALAMLQQKRPSALDRYLPPISSYI